MAKHIVQVFSQDGPVMESDLLVDAPAELCSGNASALQTRKVKKVNNGLATAEQPF